MSRLRGKLTTASMSKEEGVDQLVAALDEMIAGADKVEDLWKQFQADAGILEDVIAGSYNMEVPFTTILNGIKSWKQNVEKFK
jgi:hypothetical protein